MWRHLQFQQIWKKMQGNRSWICEKIHFLCLIIWFLETLDMLQIVLVKIIWNIFYNNSTVIDQITLRKNCKYHSYLYYCKVYLHYWRVYLHYWRVYSQIRGVICISEGLFVYQKIIGCFKNIWDFEKNILTPGYKLN